MLRRILACLLPLAAVVFALPAGAQPLTSSICQAGAVETRHSARIGAAPLGYTVCAGTLPVRNLRGEVRGRIFYTAYLVPDGRPRPLTFVWNGGPGADSRLLQFHALGPRIFSDGRLTDNEASPLGVTDLVFVDPIGTGFSRSDDPAHAADFYGTNADIASIAGLVADFRTGLSAHRRAAVPGGGKLRHVARGGRGGTADRSRRPGRGHRADLRRHSAWRYAGSRPDQGRCRSSTARRRRSRSGRLSPALQADPQRTLAEARRWAESVYAPALANPAALDPARRAALVDTLAGYQGLDPGQDRCDAVGFAAPVSHSVAGGGGQGRWAFSTCARLPRARRARRRSCWTITGRRLATAPVPMPASDAPESKAGSDWQ